MRSTDGVRPRRGSHAPATTGRGGSRVRFGRRRSDGAEAGFTLIEVVTAMVIMGVGLLTIALAQLSALRMNTRSEALTQAMYLAQEQMDLFYASPPVAAGQFQDPQNPIELDPNDRDVTNFNRSWTIQPYAAQPGMYTVTVAVTWNQAMGATGADPRTVSLEGIVGP